MLSLPEADWTALRWSRYRHIKNETFYSLRDAKSSAREVATLRWAGGDTFDVETAEGRWTLTHRGMWLQHVDVEANAADSESGAFSVKRDLRRRWRVTFPKGTTVRWRLAGLASTDWICESTSGERIVTLSVDAAPSHAGSYDPFNVRGRVSLEVAAREWLNAALILSVGWYLVVIARTFARLPVPTIGG
jgi:hypothetical protein